MNRRSDRVCRRPHKAFTLIELLVVISIIAILAALLLPAINRTRERGRQAKCIANVRSISQAVIMAATDNRLVLPDPGGTAIDNPMALKGELASYINDDEVFRCPSDRGNDATPDLGPANNNKSHLYDEVGSSYVYPDNDINGNIRKVSGRKITDSLISLSTKKVIVFEPTLLGPIPPTTSKDQWHSTKRASVCGFLDGHSSLIILTGAVTGIDATNNPVY